MLAWLNTFFFGNHKEKPLMLVPSKADMRKMSKKALEDMGRKHDIELDLRYTKDKLVNQLHKHMKSLNK